MQVRELEPYRHPDPAFDIDLPARFEIGASPGVLLTAVIPEAESGSPFRTNLTVVAQELPPGADLDEYSDASLAEAARSLDGWRLIDRERGVAGDPGFERTLATYSASGSGADFGRPMSITVEQWRRVHDGLAWIVSTSCETAEYGMVSEGWELCALSLRPKGLEA